MGVHDFLQLLGDEIQDPDEESFSLFSVTFPSSSLGFLSPKSPNLIIPLNNTDLTIHQSPTLLYSSLPTGTTGAVVWKITPLFASWLSSPQNPLFSTSTLGRESTVLELGAGISGLVALATAPKIAQYAATDQEYVMKLLRQNIAENLPCIVPERPSKSSKRKSSRAKSATASQPQPRPEPNILTFPLDWETSQASDLPSLLPSIRPFNPSNSDDNDDDNNNSATRPPGLSAILACDCIYNEALIPPFVRTCRDLALLRPQHQHQHQLRRPHPQSHSDLNPNPNPTVVLIAQQLRSHLVFEEWLRSFARWFRVWRVPAEVVGEELGVERGMVVHVGVLRVEEGWEG